MRLAVPLFLFSAVAVAGEIDSFTDKLRQESTSWTKATEHPMTDAIAEGSISKGAMIHYLVQDHKFIDAFVVLLASMIAKAPSLADRIPGAQFLALITGKENTYFERSLTSLGVDMKHVAMEPQSPAAAEFITLMRKAAESGDFGQMLAVLVAAEWTYLTWGTRVLPSALAAQDNEDHVPFWCMEWIELHSGIEFEQVVEYLRGLLDSHASTLVKEDQEKIAETFFYAVELEVKFWDEAFHSSGDDEGSWLQRDEL